MGVLLSKRLLMKNYSETSCFIHEFMFFCGWMISQCQFDITQHTYRKISEIDRLVQQKPIQNVA